MLIKHYHGPAAYLNIIARHDVIPTSAEHSEERAPFLWESITSPHYLKQEQIPNGDEVILSCFIKTPAVFTHFLVYFWSTGLQNNLS